MSQLRIELLGELSVHVEERRITRFRSRRTGELLAYLALHPERSHSREVLMELLWPEHDVPAARHSLSVALSWLRTELDPIDVIVADRYAVGLDPSRIATDVGEFEAAVRRAGKSAAPNDRLAHLEDALQAYRGHLLPGVYEDWAVLEQQRLEEAYLHAAGEAIQMLVDARQFPRAIDLAHRVLAIDSLREESHRNLMRLYAQAGRPDAASRHYEELRRRLGREVGSEPEEATTDLLRRITSGAIRPAVPVSTAEVAGLTVLRPEPVGGAVPLESPFYMLREADLSLQQAVEAGDGIVLIKGARHSGKTSLLARGLAQARRRGDRVVSCHLQGFNAQHLASGNDFLRALAENVAEQLDARVRPSDVWDDRRGPSPNLRRYLTREVLPPGSTPLVLALDEVDRLAACPFGSEIFGLFRSWHDERALAPEGPWGLLRLVLTYSTEAYLLISDPNLSPFNVGTQIELTDFTREQVAQLNQQHGSPLRSDEELDAFFSLLGGQPYLVRVGLQHLALRATSPAELVSHALDDEGPFGGHLRRIGAMVERGSDFRRGLVEVLAGRPCPAGDVFHRLRSAGLLLGATRHEAHIRCGLYANYLRDLIAPDTGGRVP